MADRFYAKAKGIHQVAAQGGHVVVRRGLTACRLLAADGRKLDGKAISGDTYLVLNMTGAGPAR